MLLLGLIKTLCMIRWNTVVNPGLSLSESRDYWQYHTIIYTMILTPWHVYKTCVLLWIKWKIVCKIFRNNVCIRKYMSMKDNIVYILNKISLNGITLWWWLLVLTALMKPWARNILHIFIIPIWSMPIGCIWSQLLLLMSQCVSTPSLYNV